jgi:hypothetical protein
MTVDYHGFYMLVEDSRQKLRQYLFVQMFSMFTETTPLNACLNNLSSEIAQSKNIFKT